MVNGEVSGRPSADIQYGSVSDNEPMEEHTNAYEATGTIMSSVINLVNTIVGEYYVRQKTLHVAPMLTKALEFWPCHLHYVKTVCSLDCSSSSCQDRFQGSDFFSKEDVPSTPQHGKRPSSH